MGDRDPVLDGGLEAGLYAPIHEAPSRWSRLRRWLLHRVIANWARAGEDVTGWEGRLLTFGVLLPPPSRRIGDKDGLTRE